MYEYITRLTLFSKPALIDYFTPFQLLGRAYYHPLEKPLIYGSIAVHIASAVLKRFIHLYTRIDRKREREQSHVSPLQTDPSSIRSPLLTWPQKTRRGLSRAFKDPVSWTGYMFLPFLIHHILINRIIPASSSFPISNLSPSELDYTFVQHSLNIFASSSSSVTGVVSGARQNSWAFINWTGYLALIGLGMAHITWGAGKTWRWLRWNWFQTTVDTSIESEGDLAAEEIQSKKGKRREWSRNIRPTNTSIYITITTLLILSLIRLDHEGRQSLRFVSGRTIERYDAVYRRLSWLYR